jgi:hypothetical protein
MKKNNLIRIVWIFLSIIVVLSMLIWTIGPALL